ncbi:restriction endonuclease subunit S [Methylomonas rapida]|uniref:Restriction endonuclease subunit S n=1 Tax=Methylomonas rapida TaxID=2963939 RepID=A0ABY7GND1_9GAMM|nr:restriction endonuclease subunit S [Methylomonas rapida]WAR46014.1 restriction endonuclease subunit S [Methylomonas rapida]
MIEQLAAMPGYEAYKDSGVEWLGEIPAHWKSQKLKFNSELRVSNVDKHSKKLELPVKLANYVDVYKNNFITDSIEFMEVTANQEEIERFSIKIDDVLITKDSEDWLDIGVPALVKYQEKNLLCGYHLAIIRSKYNTEGKFVFWALLAHYNRIQFSVKANGVTRFGISHGAIKNNWLALPPLPEQTAIAAFLDRKTAQIEQAVAIKEQQIALLKERKQILIQNAVTRGLDPNVPMRDSGVQWIGEIPAHWNLKKLKYIVRFVSGGTPSKDKAEYWNGIIPWVSPKDMKRLNIDSSIDYITDTAVKNTNIRLLDVGTILIVVRGMILAKKVPVALSKSLLTINQDMKGLIPSPDCLPEYLLYLLDGINGVLSTLLEESGHGTKTLPTEKLGLLPLGIPSKDDQSLIVTYIETQSAKIDQAISIQQQQIDKLKEYKATLINSAVTGKIRVPEVAA